MTWVRGLIACVSLGAAAASGQPAHRNVDAGGPLRPGVYGRIDVRGRPPPVIYPAPIVANHTLGPVTGQPVYWYPPPGQVRKWASSCRKYAACDVPVYFVRMDDNPSKLGQWKTRGRSQHAATVRPARSPRPQEGGAL